MASTTPEDYLETPPDLVVEVRGRDEPLEYLARRAKEYLAFGVGAAWVIDPENQTVAVHTPHGEVNTVRADQRIAPPPGIPDFNLAVNNLFESRFGTS